MMKYIIILLVLLIKMSFAMGTEKTDNTIAGSIGQMPEVVVTADQREGEYEGWVGMLDTVVVTAPRVRAFTARTTEKNSAGQTLPLAGFIVFGAVSVSSLYWFVYRRYLHRRHRMQDCTC